MWEAQMAKFWDEYEDEFSTAFKEAQKIPGCQIYLGDRNSHITNMRSLVTLPLWELIRVSVHGGFVDGVIDPNVIVGAFDDGLTIEEIGKTKGISYFDERDKKCAGKFIPYLIITYLKNKCPNNIFFLIYMHR